MKKLVNMLVVFVLSMLIVACGSSDSVKKDLSAKPTGEMSISLDIAKIFVNQSSTPIVDEMMVRILKETETPNTYTVVREVTVDVVNNIATATIADLLAGDYKIYVELKSTENIVAFGNGIAKVVAGQTNKAYISTYFPGEEEPEVTTGGIDLEVLLDLPVGDTDFTSDEVAKLDAYWLDIVQSAPSEVTVVSSNYELVDNKSYQAQIVYTVAGETFDMKSKFVKKDGYLFEAWYENTELNGVHVYFDVDDYITEDISPSVATNVFSRN